MIAARWLGLPPSAGRFFYCRPASVGVLGYEHKKRDEPILALWNQIVRPRNRAPAGSIDWEGIKRADRPHRIARYRPPRRTRKRPSGSSRRPCSACGRSSNTMRLWLPRQERFRVTIFSGVGLDRSRTLGLRGRPRPGRQSCCAWAGGQSPPAASPGPSTQRRTRAPGWPGWIPTGLVRNPGRPPFRAGRESVREPRPSSTARSSPASITSCSSPTPTSWCRGIGSVLETMMIWKLLQACGKLHATPLVMVGAMWDDLVEWARKSMLRPDGPLA